MVADQDALPTTAEVTASYERMVEALAALGALDASASSFDRSQRIMRVMDCEKAFRRLTRDAMDQIQARLWDDIEAIPARPWWETVTDG